MTTAGGISSVAVQVWQTVDAGEYIEMCTMSSFAALSLHYWVLCRSTLCGDVCQLIVQCCILQRSTLKVVAVLYSC